MSAFLRKLKKATPMKVLAAVFLLAVFYIGSATVPEVAGIVGDIDYQAYKKAAVISAVRQTDGAYHDMLGFEGFSLRNKGFYIDLNGLMARTMGRRYMNEIVKLDNGHLTDLIEEEDTGLAAAQVTKLSRKQGENGKAFLFLLAPMQIPKYEGILPPGYSDYSNRNLDEMAAALGENGVEYLDLREEMRKDNMAYADAFFVTDHHWTPETGFWAYKKIIESLAQAGTIGPVDPMYTDIGSFDVEVLEGFFLGSSGKRTGIYYAGVDDFAIISPRFETDILVEIPERAISRQGGFSEVTYDERLIKLDYFPENPYDAYGFGRNGFKHCENPGAPVDLKVLAIGDSFSRIPFAFLPLVFTECGQMDMRAYTGDFQAYYSEYDPDVLVMLANPSQLTEVTIAYDYFKDLVSPGL